MKKFLSLVGMPSVLLAAVLRCAAQAPARTPAPTVPAPPPATLEAIAGKVDALQKLVLERTKPLPEKLAEKKAELVGAEKDLDKICGFLSAERDSIQKMDVELGSQKQRREDLLHLHRDLGKASQDLAEARARLQQASSDAARHESSLAFTEKFAALERVRARLKRLLGPDANEKSLGLAIDDLNQRISAATSTLEAATKTLHQGELFRDKYQQALQTLRKETGELQEKAEARSALKEVINLKRTMEGFQAQLNRIEQNTLDCKKMLQDGVRLNTEAVQALTMSLRDRLVDPADPKTQAFLTAINTAGKRNLIEMKKAQTATTEAETKKILASVGSIGTDLKTLQAHVGALPTGPRRIVAVSYFRHQNILIPAEFRLE